METLPYRDVTLQGQGFRMNMLGALPGRALMLRLVRSLGPTIQNLELDEARALPSAAGAFLSALDPALFHDLCEVFGASNFVLGSGGPGSQVIKVADTLFAGRYFLLLEWLWANLEYNYTDFLGENGPVQQKLRAALKRLQAKAPDPTGPASPTTSTGSSAAS